MIAGRLRHRVVLQDLVIIQSNSGAAVETWVDRGTISAEIRPLKGEEYFSAQQVNSRVTHRILTRYYQNVNSINRLLFGTRVFKVVSVINPDERCTELQWMVEEIGTSN